MATSRTSPSMAPSWPAWLWMRAITSAFSGSDSGCCSQPRAWASASSEAIGVRKSCDRAWRKSFRASSMASRRCRRARSSSTRRCSARAAASAWARLRWASSAAWDSTPATIPPDSSIQDHQAAIRTRSAWEKSGRGTHRTTATSAAEVATATATVWGRLKRTPKVNTTSTRIGSMGLVHNPVSPVRVMMMPPSRAERV